MPVIWKYEYFQPAVLLFAQSAWYYSFYRLNLQSQLWVSVARLVTAPPSSYRAPALLYSWAGGPERRIHGPFWILAIWTMKLLHNSNTLIFSRRGKDCVFIRWQKNEWRRTWNQNRTYLHCRRLTAEQLGSSKPAQRQKIERYQWWNQGGLFCFWGVKFC